MTHTHTHTHTHIHTHTHTRFISLSRVNIYHSLTKENEMSLSQESVQTAHWCRCGGRMGLSPMVAVPDPRTSVWMVALQCLGLTLQLLRVAVTWFYCTSGTVCRLAGTLVSISGRQISVTPSFATLRLPFTGFIVTSRGAVERVCVLDCGWRQTLAVLLLGRSVAGFW